jgi:hypothetical protein
MMLQNNTDNTELMDPNFQPDTGKQQPKPKPVVNTTAAADPNTPKPNPKPIVPQIFAQLEKLIRHAGVESMQLVVAIDFSKSNEWTGENTYGKPLHGNDYLNPYMHCLHW